MKITSPLKKNLSKATLKNRFPIDKVEKKKVQNIIKARVVFF